MTSNEARTVLIKLLDRVENSHRWKRWADRRNELSICECGAEVSFGRWRAHLDEMRVDALLSARMSCPTCGGKRMVRGSGHRIEDNAGAVTAKPCPDCSDGQGPLLVLTALGGEPRGWLGEPDRKPYLHPRWRVWRFPVAATTSEEANE